MVSASSSSGTMGMSLVSTSTPAYQSPLASPWVMLEGPSRPQSRPRGIAFGFTKSIPCRTAAGYTVAHACVR
eukprot:367400-Prorocentrum_minimum.AAC.1